MTKLPATAWSLLMPRRRILAGETEFIDAALGLIEAFASIGVEATSARVVMNESEYDKLADLFRKVLERDGNFVHTTEAQNPTYSTSMTICGVTFCK